MQRIYQIALAGVIAIGAYASGALERLELGLLEARFSVFDRPASGDLIAVQIDARTLQELDAWPLPRETFAFVVRALHAAGAREIAIDVDMSGRADPSGTAALASALEDAGGHVILPAFSQLASPGDWEAGLVDAEPYGDLAPHAWLGSVNVVPDADGQLRRLIFGMRNSEGAFRHSMFALLAGRIRLAPEPFYVDFGIDVRSIPRVSFVDVLEGRFDVAAIDGRQVIIGGTAVELGDHFSVPRYGVMSGPMVQAMGYETLRQDREIHRTGPFAVALLVAACLAAFMLIPRRLGWRSRSLLAAATIGGLATLSFAAHELAALSLDVTPAMLACLVATAAQIMSFADAQQAAAAEQQRIAAHQRIILDRVISESSDGVAVIDARGRVEMANARAFALCGHALASDASADGLLGDLDWEPGGDWRALPRGVPVIATRGAGDARRHLELVFSATTVPDGRAGPGGAATRQVTGLTIRDVTDRVRAADAERLARQEAERANRAKTDFLASMSHELRTPLNAIIGFSDMMRSETNGPLGDPVYAEYAGHIADGGRHLLGIVNGILDISRVEMGELDIADDDVSLGETVEAALAISRGDPVVAACRIDTCIDPALPDLRGDALRIQQAVINLITNAAKFSDAGSAIRIRCAMAPDGGAMVEVADEGCGIPENMLNAILMPFQQVKSAMNRSGEGVGLGLSLVAAYMKLHGGRVEIDSTEGEGTTVRLLFPPERLASPAAA